MDWTIDLTLAVITTGITGTVLFGFWYGIGILMEKTGFLNIVYEMMKAVLLFWYVPVVYAILLYMKYQNASWGGLLFRHTPAIRAISIAFSAVWMLGAAFCLLRYVFIVRYSRRIYQNAQCCDDAVNCYFEEICEELNIRADKIELVQDLHEEVPKIIGLVKPMIVLPMREYTKLELRVIFIHELTHYKQKDLWLIYFSELAKCFHFINPFVWKFSEKVQYWGEYACDYDAVPKIGSLKGYFEVIAQMAVGKGGEHFLSAHLVEKQADLIDRMKRMNRSYKLKNKSKVKAGALVVAMIALSATAVSTATLAAGNGYLKAYFATADQQSEEDKGAEYYTANDERQLVGNDVILEECEEAGFAENIRLEYGEVMPRINGGHTFEWMIDADTALCVEPFYVFSGKSISVSASASTGGLFQVGIIEPNGKLRYVSATDGYMAYSFEAKTEGTYSAFIWNRDNDVLHIGGSFIY